MGAHPRAPSEVFFEDVWVRLDELIRARPEEMLGPRSSDRWGATLPFLFKVLAVERPLSLQAHPSRTQAMAGFAREDERGVPLDAPHRTYVDPNHKPELVCAITEFVALKGFRPVGEIRALLARIHVSALVEELESPDPLRGLLEALLSSSPDAARALVSQVRVAAEPLSAEAPFAWLLRLARDHPADPAVLAPLFLNLVRLSPGEALFLPAGELHCYLEGMAVEIMANSDNVIRGGLTSKHVDRPELLRTLRFQPASAQALAAEAGDGGFTRYLAPVDEFLLSRTELQSGQDWKTCHVESAEILLCTSGRVRIRGSFGELELRQGESAFVPFIAGSYGMSGAGTVYHASLPSNEARRADEDNPDRAQRWSNS